MLVILPIFTFLDEVDTFPLPTAQYIILFSDVNTGESLANFTISVGITSQRTINMYTNEYGQIVVQNGPFTTKPIDISVTEQRGYRYYNHSSVPPGFTRIFLTPTYAPAVEYKFQMVDSLHNTTGQNVSCIVNVTNANIGHYVTLATGMIGFYKDVLQSNQKVTFKVQGDKYYITSTYYQEAFFGNVIRIPLKRASVEIRVFVMDEQERPMSFTGISYSVPGRQSGVASTGMEGWAKLVPDSYNLMWKGDLVTITTSVKNYQPTTQTELFEKLVDYGAQIKVVRK